MSIKEDHQGVKSDCAYEPFAFNYAYCALFDYIPSGFKGNLVNFDANTQAQYRTKAENFYAMHQYITQYPTYRRMETSLGMSDTRFVQQVIPTIYSVASSINFLDLNLRLWEFNHVEHFPTRVTTTTDGAPIAVCCPQVVSSLSLSLTHAHSRSLTCSLSLSLHSLSLTS